MTLRHFFKGLIFCAILFTLPASKLLAEDINIKLLAVNPSDTEKLETEVTHLLPPEVKPEDVVDAAGMQFKYDQEKQAYVAVKKVELEPKETRTIVIRIRNVWTLSDEQIGGVREKLNKEFQSLKGTKFESTAELLFQKANDRLAQIDEERTQKMGVRQQIELYRSHVKQLNDIENGFLSMDALRKSEVSSEERTVKFVFKAQNPADQPRLMNIRTELPPDIQSEDVLDKLDFNLLYDNNSQSYVLEKQEDFAGRQEKTYTITLRDIWYIPEKELDLINSQSERLDEMFAGSNYEEFATQGTQYVRRMIEEIRASQGEIAADSSVTERMRYFVLNNQKMKLAKKRLRELQDLVLELPINKKEEDLFSKMLRGIKQVQQIADITKVLSMGIDPSTKTTWWIIFGIIGFLAVLSIVFYITFLKKLQNDSYEKKK